MGKTASYGQYAFFGGLIVAVLVGLLSNSLGTMLPLAFAILGLFGIIVGLMNITEKEVMPFLVATIALLMVMSSINNVMDNMSTVTGGTTDSMGVFVYQFLSALSVFIAPAAFVVALKQVYTLAKSE